MCESFVPNSAVSLGIDFAFDGNMMNQSAKSCRHYFLACSLLFAACGSLDDGITTDDRHSDIIEVGADGGTMQSSLEFDFANIDGVAKTFYIYGRYQITVTKDGGADIPVKVVDGDGTLIRSYADDRAPAVIAATSSGRQQVSVFLSNKNPAVYDDISGNLTIEASDELADEDAVCRDMGMNTSFCYSHSGTSFLYSCNGIGKPERVACPSGCSDLDGSEPQGECY